MPVELLPKMFSFIAGSHIVMHRVHVSSHCWSSSSGPNHYLVSVYTFLGSLSAVTGNVNYFSSFSSLTFSFWNICLIHLSFRINDFVILRCGETSRIYHINTSPINGRYWDGYVAMLNQFWSVLLTHKFTINLIISGLSQFYQMEFRTGSQYKWFW